MTVDNPAVIDFVALTADGRVSLVAVEHREWDGSPSLLADLREKINRYVAYVIEGQLVEAFPEAAGKAVTIDVRSASQPDAATAVFIDHVRQRLAKIEIRFVVRQIGSSIPAAGD